MHKGGQENNREGSLLGLKVLVVLGFCFLCTQFMIFFLRGFDFLILMRVTVHNLCCFPTTRRGLECFLELKRFVYLFVALGCAAVWLDEREREVDSSNIHKLLLCVGKGRPGREGPAHLQ
jgi:hypothetical protein